MFLNSRPIKLSLLQISFGISLLVHGAVLGTVYAVRHANVDVGTASVFDGTRTVEIVVVPEPANAAAAESPTVVKKVVQVPSPVESKPASPVRELLSPLKSESVVSIADDLSVMEELDGATVSDTKAFPCDATSATAPPPAIVCGVGCLNNPKPAYPREARRRGEQGLVLLSLTVTREGNTSEVRVAQSSGYTLLDEAAVMAVRNWKFAPARIGDTPTASKVEIPIRFRLSI